MATVNKDFKIKSGLIVEGPNGTINGSDIITEDAITGGTQTNVTVTYDAQNKVVNFVAENGVADSTTDDLAEGSTNQYFTDARAKDSAAALLTTATLTNISITGTGNGGLTITAENGVADSTTDDLNEGSTNLYFTNQRAINANTGLWDIVGAAATAEANANTYTDTAVANLVDGAPALLDTLNELAAAINDDANFASTIATSIGEKVAKAGDTMTGALTLHADPVNPLEATTKQYADGIATSLTDYIDGFLDSNTGTTVEYIDQQDAATLTAANSYTDGVIASGSLGATPLYAGIDLGLASRQVANFLPFSTAGQASTVWQWQPTIFDAAEFLVKVSNGTHKELSKILVAIDSNDNVAVTEYGIVATNGSLADITVDNEFGFVKLKVTPVETGCSISIHGTLLNFY